MNVKGNELVEKRNILNQMRNNSMSLQEQRFFSIYLAKINARDTSTRVVSFSLDNFCKIMEIKANPTQIKSNAIHLLQQVVSIPNSDGTKGFTAIQLFKRCKVFQNEFGEWNIEIDAHDEALPYLFNFKKDYFTYELWNALRLKSINQVRMYEILKQHQKQKRFEISVSELRSELYIGSNEYTRWEAFKRRVLDSCQQALKEHTDICYEYEKGKSGIGGKWLTIIFYIKANKNYVDQLTLEEWIDTLPDEADEQKEDDNQYNSFIVFMREAVNNEFTYKQVEVLSSILCQIDIKEGANGLDVSRYDYLSRKYLEMNEQAERIAIHNRYGYLKKMLEAEL